MVDSGIRSSPSLRRLSWPTKLLLVLTTTSWKPDPRLSSWFNAQVEDMRASGWTVRRAQQRNHLLWRNGATVRLAKHRLVVLPSGGHLQTTAELELLLAFELVTAKMRLEPARTEDELLARLEPFVSKIGFHHGILFPNPCRRLAQMMPETGLTWPVAGFERALERDP